MKSLLLYDFVGLYLAIRCNPYYGYPIASKMKILAMAVCLFVHMVDSLKCK